MALTTALVTGASSGIGYEIARVLASDGHDLVLVARREDNLRQLAHYLEREYKVKAVYIAVDLTDPQAAQRIYDAIQEQNIPIDILVNNAGFGTWGAFTASYTDRDVEAIETNVIALTQLTKLFSRDMVKRGLGKILNIGSVSSFMPGPYMAVYNASKAFVLSFSLALRSELKGTGVSVTVVCPGPTDSEFHQVAGTLDLPMLKQVNLMGSAQVARIAVRAMHKRKAVEIPGLLNKITALLPRLLPTRFVTWVTKQVLRPPKR
ncbi:MAG: SDR family oxidoreductase [Pseudomonadales bacterium]|nr:SDR family oxidoreductase [Pseudomonadales bacterium]